MDSQTTLTVGLFGTCGTSRWREAFIQRYQALGVAYFNPQVENWTPELADVEAWHLVNDELILFPITDETYAAGSLAETGFSVLSSLRWNVHRFVVLYIAPTVNAVLAQANPEAAKDSARARRLVRAHVEQSGMANVFVVDSLEAMLKVSITLYGSLALMHQARRGSDWKATCSPEFWQQVLLTRTSTEAEGSALVT